MAADCSAAFLTGPVLFLLVEKLINTQFLNGVEVCNHAHVVLGLISLIKCPKSLARIVGTLETKSNAARRHFFTGIAHM